MSVANENEVARRFRVFRQSEERGIAQIPIVIPFLDGCGFGVASVAAAIGFRENGRSGADYFEERSGGEGRGRGESMVFFVRQKMG